MIVIWCEFYREERNFREFGPGICGYDEDAPLMADKSNEAALGIISRLLHASYRTTLEGSGCCSRFERLVDLKVLKRR
jgi:hypothetical protein